MENKVFVGHKVGHSYFGRGVVVYECEYKDILKVDFGHPYGVKEVKKGNVQIIPVEVLNASAI